MLTTPSIFNLSFGNTKMQSTSYKKKEDNIHAIIIVISSYQIILLLYFIALKYNIVSLFSSMSMHTQYNTLHDIMTQTSTLGIGRHCYYE